MRTCFWPLLLLVAAALPVSAQETRGNISGIVKDVSGVIPGATVHITNTDTGATQQLVTNGSGYCEAPLMQPGNYRITVEMTGFKRVVQSGIVLGVSQQLSVSFVLELGTINETVTVTGEAPLIDTSSVSSSQTFDSKMVEALPMISNMPIMLTRYSDGVNPPTNQSLVSQGFVGGTSTAAGTAIGGLGSNYYSIDGATNTGTSRNIAVSPNSDMIDEMRVESSNFDASIGHGLGNQISMTTRAGANQYHGTGNYQYWTNKFNKLNPSQIATFTPSGKAFYDTGRSHTTAWTFGGPVVIPKLVNGHNKLFFFASYSYANDFIPGKNQGTSTIPASEAELNGNFSDLLQLPNPAQYQIYDPLTVHPDPANPGRFIRDPFPNNIIPANRIVNPLYNLYKQMLPKPNQNFVENGTTPFNNYYQGGQPDLPTSTLIAGRVDYNISGSDRLFIRGSHIRFLEAVQDWTYEVPAFAGLHSVDHWRPQWNAVGNWTHTSGTVVIDTQVAGNRIIQTDLQKRLHDYKPSDVGLPAYMDTFCAAQGNCMLPQVNFSGSNNYQGISVPANSYDTGRNLQGTVSVTKVTSAHTLRGGLDARLAQRWRGPGGNPSGVLTFSNEFTRQASDTAQLTPSNLGLTMAAFMLGIPSTAQVTIQQPFAFRNRFLAGYGQDSWRLTENLTLNLGLRLEWENGVTEDSNSMVTDFAPNAKLAISDLGEAAYARAPIAQLAPADFHVRGGSVYATDPGQDGAVWRPQAMWMPRVSTAYKLGEKMVLKAGYGVYYDTLNATDYTANTLGYNSTTTNTNSTDFGQTFTFGGLSNPFPVRNDGTRLDQPVGSTFGVNASTGSAFTAQNQHEHTREQKWRVGIQREVAKNTSVEVAYTGAFADRNEVSIREDYLPQQYWIPGNLNARDAATQVLLTANVTNPYLITNFTPLQASSPVLYARMASNSFFTATTTQRNRLLRPFSQINNLTFSNLPLGEKKLRSIQATATRRYSAGLTANLSVSFNRSRMNTTVEEYDRAPTLWMDDNTSRPYRLTGSIVYELPFGEGKPMLNNSGIARALAGGWQVASTFEAQPGPLIMFTTNTAGAPSGNVFYYGDIKDIKKQKPEIALRPDGTIDPNKYWFNVANFERDPAKTPTTFQTRAFPLEIPGLRGPGLHYVNLNVVRNIRAGGRRTIQLRLDCQNLFNYAAYSSPVTDPTNTNFGKVVAAVSAAGAMRFLSGGVRLTF